MTRTSLLSLGVLWKRLGETRGRVRCRRYSRGSVFSYVTHQQSSFGDTPQGRCPHRPRRPHSPHTQACCASVALRPGQGLGRHCSLCSRHPTAAACPCASQGGSLLVPLTELPAVTVPCLTAATPASGASVFLLLGGLR